MATIDSGDGYSNASANKRDAINRRNNSTAILVTTANSPYTVSGSVPTNIALTCNTGTAGTGSLSSGGTISLGSLQVGAIYPLSLSNVIVTAGSVNLLY